MVIDPLALLVAISVGGTLLLLVRAIATARDAEHRTSRERLSAIAQPDISDVGEVRRRQRRRAPGASGAGTRRWLRRAGLRWEPADFVGVTVASMVVPAAVAALVTRSPQVVFIIAAVGVLLPAIVVQRRARQRAGALNAQVVEMLEVVASSLRSGFGFTQSLEVAAREQRDPIAAELVQCVREIHLGAATDEALQRLVERTADDDLELAINAVVIQRRVGGDLSEVLSNIASMIRERVRIRGEINTLTAQARMSSWIIGLLPVALGGMMAFMQPEHMRVLVEHPAGQMMLGIAVVMEAIGFLLVRRIAAVEY